MPIRNLSTHPAHYLTVAELANYWAVGRPQIYKRIESGALGAIRLGARIYRVPTEAALAFERRASVLTAPLDGAVVRRLRRSLLTLRELGKRFTPGQSAQERVRALIDRLQVAILVLDEQGRYVAVSRGASTLTGYTRAELLNMSVSDSEVASAPRLAAPWHEFLTNPQSAVGTTIRDKSGNIVNIQTAFATLLPGLHATAFAISEHAADREPSA
jgi:excisionase family DNA binding protein